MDPHIENFKTLVRLQLYCVSMIMINYLSLRIKRPFERAFAIYA